MTGNADEITYWNETAGTKWVDNQTKIDRLMAPLTEALVDAASPRTGETVLDVGCGCGDLSLQLARRVGPDGRVRAVDVSRPMLAHAHSRAAQQTGAAPIEWIAADAMTQVLAPDTDLLVSRFGVMFFDDKSRAFRNLRTSLRSGGRFAFLTWRRSAEVEWMQRPIDWLSAVLPPPEDTTGAVGPFGLADADATVKMLGESGFQDVSADKVDRPLTIGTSVDEACHLLSRIGRAAAMMAGVEPDQKAPALDHLRKGLESQKTADGIVMGGACWLYRGRA